MFRTEFPEPTPDKASQAVRGFYEEAQKQLYNDREICYDRSEF